MKTPLLLTLFLLFSSPLWANSGFSIQPCGTGWLTSSPTSLSPADNQLNQITITYSRASSGPITVAITSLTSSCDNEAGELDIFFDPGGTQQLNPPATVKARLRSEACDTTRIYTIHISCDGASPVTVLVSVP